MEAYRKEMGTESYRAISQGRSDKKLRRSPAGLSTISSLSIGAKTIAGIGLGLIAVIGGAAIIGVAAESVLIPSILMKLAGGVAGGGVGMAKGISDAKKEPKE